MMGAKSFFTCAEMVSGLVMMANFKADAHSQFRCAGSRPTASAIAF
jgi:hypothetical protein